MKTGDTVRCIRAAGSRGLLVDGNLCTIEIAGVHLLLVEGDTWDKTRFVLAEPVDYAMEAAAAEYDEIIIAQDMMGVRHD